MSQETITIIEGLNAIGKTVTVKGWVQNQRDMAKLLFLDLRDHTGVLQVVIKKTPDTPKLSTEDVIEMSGEIRGRKPEYINDKIPTGTIEMSCEEVTIINHSAELPFELTKDTREINEELRLKYRYLDIRSERMTRNLRLRHKVIKFFRDYLDNKSFIEVETPILTKGTPEGAREFLVPSRLHPEKFFVLPQSPQQYKQLLMVAGIGKYFQIARCLRDEDQRGDRQPEFTQLDLEMSFVSQEDILSLNEQMIVNLVKEVAPDKHISVTPFPRLTYTEAMEKYGTDKPDLRKNKEDATELSFCWIVDFPMFEQDKDSTKLNAVHHPFTRPLDEDTKILASEPLKSRAAAYDIVLNGYEIGGGSLRIHEKELQSDVFKLLGLSEDEIESRFGHILEAFSYGVPPHGGIAYGLDRLIMVLADEPNIREVIAFPKTGDARDPLTGAPTPASAQALKEAHISTTAPKKR